MSSKENLDKEEKNKYDQFQEDIKNEYNMEKKLDYLFKKEFENGLPDILILNQSTFLDQIKNGVSLSLELKYTNECLSNNNLQNLIEKSLEKIKTQYLENYKIINEAIENKSKSRKNNKHFRNKWL